MNGFKTVTINQNDKYDPDYIGMIKTLASLGSKSTNPYYGHSISTIARLLLEKPIKVEYNKYVYKDRWDIFLSYSYDDREIANQLYTDLAACGLSIWYDRKEISGGEQWSQALIRGIKSSSIMVALFGKQNQSKISSQKEIHYAISQGLTMRKLPIIPVLIGSSTPKDIPIFLRDRTYFDLRDWNKTIMNKLMNHLCWLQDKDEILRSSSPRVFLCHAKEDEKRVEEIYFIMKELGLDPWYDKDKLKIGDRWEEEISLAISQSDFFAVFLSTVSINKRGFIQREIRTAAREYQLRPQGITYFLPIRLENFEVPHIQLDHNTYLTDFQWFDAFEGNEEAIIQLSHDIKMKWRRHMS